MFVVGLGVCVAVGDGKSEAVTVVVRCRPFLANESGGMLCFLCVVVLVPALLC